MPPRSVYEHLGFGQAGELLDVEQLVPKRGRGDRLLRDGAPTPDKDIHTHMIKDQQQQRQRAKTGAGVRLGATMSKFSKRERVAATQRMAFDFFGQDIDVGDEGVVRDVEEGWFSSPKYLVKFDRRDDEQWVRENSLRPA